ncbi:MAG TPA: hypothetical protein VF939_03260 [Puia sp.]
MKKLLTILLLFAFGVYSFTYKTHYCYYADGHRFHGDCQKEIRQAKEKLGNCIALLLPKHYICQDIQMDKQFHQRDYSFKNFSDTCYILPVTFELQVTVSLPGNYAIPVFSCRGGPPLGSSLLRGPPTV